MSGKILMKKVICYGLSLMLLTFYLFLLLSGIHPKVSLEYRMYYVDRTLANWPGNGGLQYEPGEPLSFCMISKDPYRIRRRGKGWGRLMPDGCRWSQERADVYFTGMEQREYTLEASLTGLAGDVLAVANQKELGSLQINEDGAYTVRIPADCIGDDGWLTLTLVLQPYSSETLLQRIVLY